MARLEVFDVDIVQPGDTQTYHLDESFWKRFEYSPISSSQLQAKVDVNKTPSTIKLAFSITGSVALVCDRSLEEFAYPLQVDHTVDFKLGHECKEIAVDLYEIDRQTASINVAQHLYDLVILAIPMKRIHPRFEDPAAEAISA